MLVKGFKTRTLYTIRETTKISDVATIKKEGNSLELCHKSLGHMSEKGLKVFVCKNLLLGLKSLNLIFVRIVFIVGNEEFL